MAKERILGSKSLDWRGRLSRMLGDDRVPVVAQDHLKPRENCMSRRYAGNMNGEQFLGNTNSKEVHDLDNEDTNASGCQIDEIIRAGHDTPFRSLTAAHAAGYDNCAKCLSGSRR